MTVDEWLKKLNDILGNDLFDELKVTYVLAEEAHKAQKRNNGEPYILHPIRVCIILADELDLKDRNTLMAALLHDVVEDTPVTIGEIENLFGKKVAEYVNFLTKSDDFNENIDKQKEYFKNLKKAPRKVQLIKLADRLDNLRDLAGCGDEMKIRRYMMDMAYNFMEWSKKTSPYIHAEYEDLMFQYKEKFGDFEIN
jgi:(p)ppGpp synthase/HD superfamily hydrolase